MVYLILLLYKKYHKFPPKWDNKKPHRKLIKHKQNKQNNIMVIFAVSFYNVGLNVKIPCLLCIFGGINEESKKKISLRWVAQNSITFSIA